MHELTEKILSGNRRAIAKAITLIESSRDDHQDSAQALLSDLLPHSGNSIRLGLTGTPGVGKSTFIETFGKMLTAKAIKVAVLAVDPSSKVTGGSILGDKTRMEELARDKNAFIRPTPSKGTLGGIARYTREAMIVLEASGYDLIIIETVGVGQSEVAVADLVDMFVLLLSPGGGDELQGIKRGIMELADLIIVNKADGDFKDAAKLAASYVRNALHLMKPKSENWTVKTLEISSLNNIGIKDVWKNVEDFRKLMIESGEFARKRSQQSISSIWSEISELLISKIKTSNEADISVLELKVRQNKITSRQAAESLINTLLKNT